MEKRVIVFGANRDGYGIDQIKNHVTVGELIRMLEDFDEDTPIILSHDGGYTYGSLSRTAEIREEVEGDYGKEYETMDEIGIW